MNRSIIVLGTIALAIAIFAGGAMVYSNSQNKALEQVALDSADVLRRNDLPLYGNQDARVSIVEFLDPACEACRAFHPVVKQIVDSSFGQVNVLIRYAAFHKGSSDAIRLLEGARAQGKFWPVLEALFESQSVWASHQAPDSGLIWSLVQDTGIDVDKAREVANSPKVDRLLVREKSDAQALQVSRTPTFFVNGKPLTDFGANQLKSLVDSELRTSIK